MFSLHIFVIVSHQYNNQESSISRLVSLQCLYYIHFRYVITILPRYVV